MFSFLGDVGQTLTVASHMVKASRSVYLRRRHFIPGEEMPMAQATLPPWIQALHQRDPEFVDSYMAQRERILRDGAIPAKYKHLMTMIVDALQTHPDGVATIANRARALVTAMNAFRAS